MKLRMLDYTGIKVHENTIFLFCFGMVKKKKKKTVNRLPDLRRNEKKYLFIVTSKYCEKSPLMPTQCVWQTFAFIACVHSLLYQRKA